MVEGEASVLAVSSSPEYVCYVCVADYDRNPFNPSTSDLGEIKDVLKRRLQINYQYDSRGNGSEKEEQIRYCNIQDLRHAQQLDRSLSRPMTAAHGGNM